ncbi:hypothetical protein K2173_017372 [Erythroxylum novogranatense]|uniref:Homogentisate phytyltransferase n=1 Tax=Erythroxylum novogranatense TaxID=1862640 RepID=A0AAV8TN39_9ROSI|nr:hypothetical protein K2173_017372 [Erythroxylum novogranatense]
MESLVLATTPKLSSFSSFPSDGSCRTSDNLKVDHSSSRGAFEISWCRAWDSLNRRCVTRFQQHCFKDTIEGSTTVRPQHYRNRKEKFSVHAASGQPLESKPGAFDPKRSVLNSLYAFYRFSRPHTVIGTGLGIVSISLLAVEKLSDFSPVFFTGLLEALTAALMMNIYIVGLNQLADVEIDKVNKPYLPLASGEYSMGTGLAIIMSFVIMSFCLGWIAGSWPLFWALFISFVLGTAYSINLPLLRWKRFAVIAAMCILAVRAVIVQLAFYLHMQTHVYGRPAIYSRPLIFATAFMSFFSVVIALFKDIPDMEGDKIYGIRTFTVSLGQKRVFWTCIALLEVAYGVAVLVGLRSSYTWSKWITVFGHAILAFLLWNHAKSVDLKNTAAITSCYMFIWKVITCPSSALSMNNCTNLA